MSTRSSRIKKRHGIGRAVRRMKMARLPRVRMPVNKRAVKALFFRFCVLAGVLLLIFGAWQLVRPGKRIQVSADLVAAFQVPHRAIGMLEFYAYRHDVPFAELFTIFLAENAFFPDKTVTHDLRVIEQLYVVDFERIRRRYNARSLATYAAMFDALFSELEAFPIPAGWYEDEPSVMFGDSWGMTHNMQGNRSHMGTAILDRENVRGRVPVVSMTHGRIEEAGWNNQLGYFIGVTTINGTYYLYAHMDSLAHDLRSGQMVHAGQALGYMGNTGGGRGAGAFPVQLHIGISPVAEFTRGRFWINPYPLLRYLEAR
ncbi:MAG: M23 family metallopeptidase [Defluviitaleaceae bacterium]|nr:M23 family metallopeptidase [Defluviitaleaceae bacterium]MCL2274183.1 M23 family metallopeptidase [Defluviitaleaceae bacterium]